MARVRQKSFGRERRAGSQRPESRHVPVMGGLSGRRSRALGSVYIMIELLVAWFPSYLAP